MKDQTKAYIFAYTAILLWSTMASAFKITLSYIDPDALVFLATAVSLFVLGLILLVQKKFGLLVKTSGSEFLWSALLGFLNPFFYYLVLFRAYSFLQAQEAGTLNYFWPVLLVLLSIPVLGQRIRWLSVIAILISFVGLMIISTRGRLFSLDFSDPLGVALALGSALIWAVFWLFNLKDKRDEVVKLFTNFAFSMVFISCYFLFTGVSLNINGNAAFVGAVYIGVFEMGITFIFWLKALRYSETTAKVTNLVYLSPFISLIIIRFAVGEKILWSTVIGLMLIIGGIILQRSESKILKTK